MNSPFVIEQCVAAGGQMAARELELKKKIRLCFEQVLSRRPSDAEFEKVSAFLQAKDDSEQWSLVYQTLVQSIDFRFVK